MWVLEGVADVEQEYLENKKKGSRMKKPTYIGISAREREYKKKASGNSNHKIHNACVLRVDEALVDWGA
jgi:hypothetical protein